MTLILAALAWLFAPERLTDSNAIPLRLGEHLFYTVVSVLLAAVIAIPIGYLIGHTGRGRELAVAVAGAARALPSFGLLLVIVFLIGTTRAPLAAVLSFVLLAIPSVLAGAYSGVEAIDRRTVDAARAVGMTEWQILVRVEIPLGLPLLLGGLRNAALQVVATVTLAAYIGLGGLGIYIFRGLSLRRYEEMLGGAILIVLLAIVIDAAFAILQRLSVPRGIVADRRTRTRASSPGPRASMGSPIADK